MPLTSENMLAEILAGRESGAAPPGRECEACLSGAVAVRVGAVPRTLPDLGSQPGRGGWP